MFKASITFVLALLLVSVATTVAVPVAIPKNDSMMNRYERRDQLEKRWSMTWKKALVGLGAVTGLAYAHKKYKQHQAKKAVAAADNKAQGTPAPAAAATSPEEAAPASQATSSTSQSPPPSQGSAPSQASGGSPAAGAAAGAPPAYPGPSQ